MLEKTLFRIDLPYRDPMEVRAFLFGATADGRRLGEPDVDPADFEQSIAFIGAMRGDEVQQTYICSRLVHKMRKIEADGEMEPGRLVMIVPCVNPASMDMGRRFWVGDGTDINRMMPGYDQGETTQRIAAGLFRGVQGFRMGVHFSSFYLRGDFLDHVRVMTGPGEGTDEGELFGLMLALSRARMNIFQEKGHAELLTSGAYLQYQHTLGTFCDDQNGTLKNWLGGPDKPVRISYEAALFFTYLMTRREACLRADEQGMSCVQAFASYCLSCLGVSGIEAPVASELSDFAWRCSTRSGGLDDPADQALLGTEAFCNLSSKSVILLAAALMTVLELLGKDEDKVAGATERFHRFMADLMQEEIDVASGVDEAERSLMDCIRTFEPRSIQVPIGEAWSPLDFYVEPDFCQGDASVQDRDWQDHVPADSCPEAAEGAL